MLPFPARLWLISAMMDRVRATLKRLVPAFRDKRVAVVGDPVLDCYVYGTTHRISREAPVLIVREDGRELRLGGAANTAANLAGLGANASLFGLVGDDDDGRRLMKLAKERGIATEGMLPSLRRCTVTKTRVLAGGLHTTKQQMLRIDRENDGSAALEDEEGIRNAAERILGDLDALVVSDYGDGALTPLYQRLAQRAKDLGKIVVVDSRYSLASYRGVTAVTPNEPEVEAALGISLGSADSALEAAARLQHELDIEATVLTRGSEGMAVAARGQKPVLLAAHGGHEAVDVTGAGDTVTAALSLALAAGATVLEAAALANCAASIVVMSIGTATCSPEQLLSAVSEIGP